MSSRAMLGCVLLGILWAAPVQGRAWLEPEGGWWWKVGFSASHADEKFANDQIDATKSFRDGRRVEAGDRIPFDFVTGGRYETQSYVLESAYGIQDWLEISAVLPLLHTVFENDNDEVEPGTGLGDVRLGLGSRIWHSERAVVSAVVQWKLPTADVPRTVFAQPLGEGQHDLTLTVSTGWSLWPRGWLIAEAGYSWRQENRELGFDPGNEGQFGIEWGWQLRPRLALKNRLDGLQGAAWTSREFGFEQETGTRRLWSYAPALLIEVGRTGRRPITVEIGASIALLGEDLPVNRELRVGVMTQFDVRSR